MPTISPTIDRTINTISSGISSISALMQLSAGSQVNQVAATSFQTLDYTDINIAQVIIWVAEFDTSDINTAPSSATLKIYGKTNSQADVICAKTTLASAGAIVTGDWDAWNPTSPTAYTNTIDSSDWSTSGYNDFTFNATALSDMASLDEFQMVCMEATYAYTLTSNPQFNIVSGFYTSYESGTDKDPYIDYTAAAGWVPKKYTLKVKSSKLNVKDGKLLIK